jgi:hypothetical protein
VSTGYFVAVPWQTYPGTEKVRVAVRLTTLDGRTFEADRDVFVKPCLSRANPVPGGPAVPFPGPGPGPAPAIPSPAPPGGREPLFPDPIPPGTEELPPPAPAERGARILPPVKQ